MFEYLICVISPVTGDYEPGEPECGFLFPAFFDGGAALNCGKRKIASTCSKSSDVR